MSTARDWLKTLWAASYKSTPFFVEKDNESGSRRIVEHEFPMRDDPYLEDLGEGVRHYQVTAYVASDRADGEASSVMQTCATRGPGILVLPTHGPILVRCLEFERDRSKDKHGYIAHSLKFSREGATGALASVSMLANMVFVAADNLGISAAAQFVASLIVTNQPDFVISAASDGLQDAAATLDAVRVSQPVDPVVSAAQRNEIQAVFDDIPDMVEAADPSAPERLIAVARAIGDGLDPAVSVAAFADVIETTANSDVIVRNAYPTVSRYHAAVNAAEAARVLRLAAIAAYCEAVVRAKLTDRPAAISLRANVSEYLEAELQSMPSAEIDLYHAIAGLRDAAVDYLSRAIIDLAPVLTVEANMSVPSLYWAWRLYANPNRSREIADRNLVPHPSFIPPTFEALAK